MNRFINKGDFALEVGCGTGISKDFIRKDCTVMLTDFADYEWVERKVDALDTKFPAAKFDAVYCSNMVHHVPFPKKFFFEMSRILKPGGALIIQEINCSLMMRILLRIARHEGWSFRQDVFSTKTPCTDSKDLWSANCAIPNLLFDDSEKFEREVGQFKIIHSSFSEFLLFPLSGGVIAKMRTIDLPLPLLKTLKKFDDFVSGAFPGVFALQRQVVLKKRGNGKKSPG